LDKYFNRATSEHEENSLEEPHHSENCDNISSHTDGVMPDSQRGRLCARSEVSHFESLQPDKGGSSSTGASDEFYQIKICRNYWMNKRSCHLAMCH